MSNVKESYGELVNTMKALGTALIPATAARYDAPPRSTSAPESGSVRNPTLDIVMDPRRSSLSDAVCATDTALRQARALLAPHVPALNDAVARWEGLEGPPK